MGSDSGLLARAEGMETLSGDVRDRSENLRNELLGGPDTGVGLQGFVEKRPL